jgi:hypothetical protein
LKLKYEYENVPFRPNRLLLPNLALVEKKGITVYCTMGSGGAFFRRQFLLQRQTMPRVADKVR